MSATRQQLITAPAEEPLTTAEAKLHLRVDLATEDALIDRLIAAARQRVELELRRALITQTWDFFLDCWPRCRQIRLPMPPLVSVTHVKYYDEANTLQTFALSNYEVATGTPGRVALKEEASWPTLERRPDAVQIRFVAGYGAAAAVPAAIKQAMLLLIGHWYKHREQVITGTIAELPMAVEALLDCERWGSYT